MKRINYDKRIFKSIANSGNGEVTGETRFYYHQKDNYVWAEYSGGEILFGNLIAQVFEDYSLEMRYQHLNKNGELMTGKCVSTPEIMENGKIRLHERWQWTIGDFSSGESIIEETDQ